MERRQGIELRRAAGSPLRLAGYAAVFDSPSADLGGFTEVIRPGAFTRSLAGSPDVLALVHHRPELVLGRTTAKTLRLQEDQRGLAFEVDLPDTATARDLLVSVERGDIRGASFAFTIPKGGDRWSQQGAKVLRELLDVELRDVTITSTPAYQDTDVARRVLATLAGARHRLALARRYLETC